MFEMKLEVENDGGVALMRFSHFLLLRYPRQSHLKSAHLYEREQHFGYNLWEKKKKEEESAQETGGSLSPETRIHQNSK